MPACKAREISSISLWFVTTIIPRFKLPWESDSCALAYLIVPLQSKAKRHAPDKYPQRPTNSAQRKFNRLRLLQIQDVPIPKKSDSRRYPEVFSPSLSNRFRFMVPRRGQFAVYSPRSVRTAPVSVELGSPSRAAYETRQACVVAPPCCPAFVAPGTADTIRSHHQDLAARPFRDVPKPQMPCPWN